MERCFHAAVIAFLALHGQDLLWHGGYSHNPLRHISELDPKTPHDATSRLADCRRSHSQFVRHKFRWQAINGCSPKRFPTWFFEDARVRFEREILAAGRLQHPAIVSATDAGQFGDMDYLVMEYVRGMDLGRLSKSIPTLSIEETCEIGRQIALGLSYAHAQGLVHRDIKPSNVILDDAGAVKILDFGLVLFDRWDGVSSELTTVGQFLGTLDYMAPEQAERCGAVDYRADLYALGATMFKLLCGRAPLAAAPNQSLIDKLRLLASHRPPSLITLRPDAPKELVKLVDSLLATSPQERPASAAHVAEDLLPWAKSGCLIELIAKARSVEGITATEDAVSSKGDRNMFNPIAYWSQDNVFANRMLQELEKSDHARRMLLLNLTGMTIPEKLMDPIWNWLEGISKTDPKTAELLTRSVLGLEDGAFKPYRPLDIISLAYLTERFPRLASLFDSYLISNFSGKMVAAGTPRVYRNKSEMKALIAYVQRVAMASLEKTDSGFADRVASLAVVVSTPYENMSSDQKEMVSNQIANLLSQAWENRTTPYAAEWAGFGEGQSLGAVPNSLNWHSKRKAMSVPRLLNMLSWFMSSIKWDKRPPVILSALADLEAIARPEAMTAWSELPTELQGALHSEFTFNGYDFRLEEKRLNQLPSTLTPERKEQIDRLSVAYMLHRYASFLLWGINPPNNPSPDVIGEQLAAFREQDANQDWLLSEDEWPLEFKSQAGRAGQRFSLKPLGIQWFVDATTLPPVSAVRTQDQALREWATQRLKKMDTNNDGYLSPDEATGLDFEKTDTDKDGRISVDEYIRWYNRSRSGR